MPRGVNSTCNQMLLCGQVPGPLTSPGCVALGTIQTEPPDARQQGKTD